MIPYPGQLQKISNMRFQNNNLFSLFSFLKNTVFSKVNRKLSFLLSSKNEDNKIQKNDSIQ